MPGLGLVRSSPPTPAREPVARSYDAPVPQAAVDDLIQLLDLEPIEVNIFRGVSPDVKQQRVFGGQVAGQALVAAARTVVRDDSSVHSLHAYFLRPGDPAVPILYEVDRIRDAFVHHAARGAVSTDAHLHLSASFHFPRRVRPPAPVPRRHPAVEILPRLRAAGRRGRQAREWYDRPAAHRHALRRWSPLTASSHAPSARWTWPTEWA